VVSDAFSPSVNALCPLNEQRVKRLSVELVLCSVHESSK
jgi:hypothetical protein